MQFALIVGSCESFNNMTLRIVSKKYRILYKMLHAVQDQLYFIFKFFFSRFFWLRKIEYRRLLMNDKNIR